MGWAQLFSSRVPVDSETEGTVDAHFERDGAKTGWTGNAVLTLPPFPLAKGAVKAGPSKFIFVAQPEAADGLRLALLPAKLETSALTAITVSGLVWSDQQLQGGYSLSVEGEASAAQLWLAPRYLPPVGDGLDVVMNSNAGQPNLMQRVAFQCQRAWGGSQTCSALTAPVKKRRR
jgi:hypothetical protein